MRFCKQSQRSRRHGWQERFSDVLVPLRTSKHQLSSCFLVAAASSPVPTSEWMVDILLLSRYDFNVIELSFFHVSSINMIFAIL